MSEPQATDTPSTAPTVSFREALAFWFHLGLVSFGGPAGQIALMHRELVERRRWISERRFLHALNYCMLLPGPEAQQLATYIGWLMHRARGGIVAGGLFVLPSLFVLIVLSWIYMAYGQVPVIAGIFYGIKPAVAAIVVHAAHRIGKRVLHNTWLWTVAALSFLSILVLNLPFPLILGAAALSGLIGDRRYPAAFYAGTEHGGGDAHGSPAKSGKAAEAATTQTEAPALIDDDTPTPAHARFQLAGLIRVVAVGLLLWLAPLLLLAALFGWRGALTQMGAFFTKAALLTFGGAYAVLPYVHQNAVEHFHWLTTAQMMDGLALGETTPGPLIMVVAFVGFVGGWAREALAVGTPLAAGIVGACVATYFTFLPSFLFILGGGPLVESTRGKLGLIAPLTAITAAVVGVIVNLALFFGVHVAFPGGIGGRFDFVAAILCAAAAVLLFRVRLGIIPVIGLCGLAGLLLRLAGLA